MIAPSYSGHHSLAQWTTWQTIMSTVDRFHRNFVIHQTYSIFDHVTQRLFYTNKVIIPHFTYDNNIHTKNLFGPNSSALLLVISLNCEKWFSGQNCHCIYRKSDMRWYDMRMHLNTELLKRDIFLIIILVNIKKT